MKLTWPDVKRAAKMSYGDGRAPRLKDLAEFIDNKMGDRFYTCIRGTSETPSRHLFGNVSHFYKTRHGHTLEVFKRGALEPFKRPVFEHKTTDPYRRNWEVARWIVDNQKQGELKP